MKGTGRMSKHLHTEPSASDIHRHLEFFARLPEGFKPTNIERVSETSYSYDRVAGHMPATQGEVRAVHETANRILWRPTIPISSSYIDQAHKEDYIEYVQEKAAALWLNSEALANVFDIIRRTPLYRVDEVHGDLTLENVLITGVSQVVFIDPGHPRGLVCKELDQAKILQSTFTKWDLMNGSSGSYWLHAPFVINPIHLALLATHWIRLLNHPERHNHKLIGFGQAVLQQLWERINDLY
jgi:hypothetical protein